MKAKNYLFFFSVLIILSCQSEKEIIYPTEEEYPVKFSLALREEVLPFTRTRSIPPLNMPEPVAVTRGDDEDKTLEDLCCTIEYIVFQENKLIRRKSYCPEDLDFGIISDQLPRGGYDIIIVAHNSPPGDLTDNNLSFEEVSDTFHYSFYMDIEPGEKNEENVTLYRVVSKVEFISTDKVPDNAREFSIQLDKYSYCLNIKSGHGEITEESIDPFIYSLTEHSGETNLTHSFFSFVPEKGITMHATLKTVSIENEIIRERTVQDIEPIINKIIRYSGRLYNPSHSEDEFTITIDENGAWNETIEDELED